MSKVSDISVSKPVKVAVQKRRGILIVDDEPLITEVLSSLLSLSFDCPIHTFNDPREALASVRELNPGFIISDYMMPHIKGIELIQRIHEILPTVPSLIVSGYIKDTGVDSNSKALGIVKVLNKPFDTKEVVCLIRSHMETE